MGYAKISNLLRYRFCPLCSFFHTFCCGFSAFPGSCGGIFLFDIVLLPPAGNGIRGSIRILFFELFKQSVDICLIRFFNQLFRLVIGFQLMAVCSVACNMISSFCSQFRLVGCLNPHIIILIFGDGFVGGSRQRIFRSTSCNPFDTGRLRRNFF